MLCLIVITFSPRLMVGNGSLGEDESPRKGSQVGEHENGIFKSGNHGHYLCVSIFKEPLSTEAEQDRL